MQPEPIETYEKVLSEVIKLLKTQMRYESDNPGCKKGKDKRRTREDEGQEPQIEIGEYTKFSTLGLTDDLIVWADLLSDFEARLGKIIPDTDNIRSPAELTVGGMVTIIMTAPKQSASKTTPPTNPVRRPSYRSPLKKRWGC